MPDPALYGRALIVTLLASLSSVFLLRRCLGRSSPTRNALAEMLGVSIAVVVGLAVLHVRPRLPPLNGLDRFLVVVLPLALGIEIVTATARLTGKQALLWRCVGAATFGGILLYGSVHLQPDANAWSASATWVWLIVWGVALIGAWQGLVTFVRRTRDLAVPLALSGALLCAGLLIMMAGYLKGGSVAFPLAAALAGAACRGTRNVRPETMASVTGLGVVALFGLLIVGRYFGGLTTGTALVVFGAPLLAWWPESSDVSRSSPRKRVWLRLAIVALPLAFVLFRAKLDFDQKMRSLAREFTENSEYERRGRSHAGVDVVFTTGVPCSRSTIPGNEGLSPISVNSEHSVAMFSAGTGRPRYLVRSAGSRASLRRDW